MTLPSGFESSLVLYVVATAVLIYLVLFGIVIHLEIKVRRLLRGKDARSLEDTIVAIHKGWQTEKQFKEEMKKYLLDVEKRLSCGVRSPETLRFNAFAGTGTGGNQSFATAYVDERGNGVILSSLAARDRVSVFTKPIKVWKSEFELTPEEQTVLDRSKQSCHKNLTA